MMFETIKAAKVIGFKQLLTLGRTQQLAWPGILNGYYTTRIIQTLFNVGFFDALTRSGSLTAQEFADSEGLDADMLSSLCDALYASSILKKNGNRYSLDEDGKLLIGVGRGWFDRAYGYEEIFHELEPMLRKEKLYGKDIFRGSRFVAKGSGEIENWVYFPLAIDIIKKNGFHNVLDLGCGDATFLRAVCKANPDIKGYGVDIAPAAIEEGKEQVRKAGLQDRIELLVEDISKVEETPEALRQVDVATTFFVLHELLYRGEDSVLSFLQSYKRILPGVPFVIFEAIRPTPEEMRRKPGMGIPYFLEHDLTHQKPVGRKEWMELFKRAGFESVDERYLSFARTAIYTLR